MPESEPRVDDPVWDLVHGNGIILGIDDDEDTVLWEVQSFKYQGEVIEVDLYTLTASWTDRFGGLYMLVD